MKVLFCGAAREVTGSCHLVTLDNGYKILLDCGLYQGHSKTMADFNANWHFNPAEIDCMVLSHAHIDHTGRNPKLVKDGKKMTSEEAALVTLEEAKKMIEAKIPGAFDKKPAKSGKAVNKKPAKSGKAVI